MAAESDGDQVYFPQARPYFPSRPPAVLFYHESMKALAESIAEKCCRSSTGPVYSVKGYPGFQQAVELQNIKWNKFADGWPNLFIENVKQSCAGRDVIFLGSFHSPAVVFEQLSVIYNIPRYLARSFTLIVPYFPTATMERVQQEGEIATAKTLATMLSSIPSTARGPPQIVVFDIHALQERFYFGDHVIPRLESAIPLLLREIATLRKRHEISIAFPDDGAHKRFHTMFKDLPTIICVKIREGDKRIVKVKEGEPQGKYVIIVDDLVMTGGTLIQCAKALIKRGAVNVSAYVTHGVFPRESWKQFTDCDVKFDNFYITNSLPWAEAIAQHPPFKLLSLCDALSNTLLGFDLLQS